MKKNDSNNTYNIEYIADYILQKKHNITHKKLQKLLYLSYSWYLAIENNTKNIYKLKNKLFKEQFEAWVHGPTNKKIYDKYKSFGYKEISNQNNLEKNKFSELKKNDKEIINEVLDVYGKFNADELENITKKHKPYIKTRRNLSFYDPSRKIIKDKDIYIYYKERLK